MMQSTVNTPVTELVRLEDLSDATTPVAMLRQEPIELVQSNHDIEFKLSYDGLDYLDFASLTLRSGENITLVRHHGCPEPGTEICVATKPENAAVLIDQTCEFLNLNKTDLIWVHPEIPT